MKGKKVVKRMLSLALSAAMIATMLPAQPAQAAQGKTAMPEKLMYFSFDEGAQTGEDGKAWMDGGKAKGEVLGTAGNLSISTTDKHNGTGALELKGSAWLQLVSKENAEDNLLAGKTDVTISYWSKTAGEPGWGWYASKGNKGSTEIGNKENYIGILDNPTSVTVERYKEGRGKPSIKTSDVKSGEWRFVTVVLGQEETVLYINGERKNSQLEPWPLTDILDSGSRLLIGRANWGSGEFFKGLIDDFTVYDGALTAIQVREILYLGKTEEDLFNEIELAPGEDLHIVEGKSRQLKIKDIENFSNITYTSDNPAVAAVDEATGMVTGVSVGKTAITAKVTLNGKAKEVKTKVEVGKLSAFETAYPFDGSLGDGVQALKGNKSNFEAYDASGITYEDGRKAGENASDKAVKTGEFGIRLPQKNLGSDYTVSVWVNPLDNNVINNSPVLSLGKGVGKTDNWPAVEESWIAVAGTGSKDAAKNVLKVWANSHIAGDYNNTGGAKNILSKNFDMPKNAWSMLTVSQAGNNVSIYLNGKLLGSAKATAALTQNNEDDRYIHLGLNYWDDEFVGLVDEAKVYTVALDAKDVAAEYLKSATKEERRAYLGLPSEEELSFVTGDITLPTDVSGIQVAWKSSAPEIISNDGKLAAEVMDGSQVTLTATGSCQGEKVFEETFTAALAVEIIKKYVDKNNAELKTEVVAEKQRAGSQYTYVPEDNPQDGILQKDGKVYVRDAEGSSLTIPKVGKDARTITIQYAQATINDQEIAVTTRPGVAPELPDRVEATFSNGIKQEVDVTWKTEEITEDQYDTAGKTFSVTGAFANDPNAKLSAKVTVVSRESFLLAQYGFEGDNFLNDSTQNGKNGTAQGTVTQVAGMKGSAAYLNRGAKGQSSIKLPDNLLAGKDGKVQDKLTVSMFMRPEVDGNSFAMTLHGADTNNYIGLINKPSEFSITYRKSGKTDEQAKGAAGTDRGKWVHVAFVADGENLKLYKDGKLVSSVRNTIKASDFKAQNNYIGYSMWNDSDDKGAFDEFEVYGAALTDAEIRAISDAGYQQQVDAVKGNIRTALSEANQAEGGAAFDTENVVGDIKLPTSLASSLEGLDIQVSWASSQESVIKANGEVIRPNQDTKVTLTPTVTAGSYSVALEGIQVTVKESENVNYKRIEDLIKDAKASYEGKRARQIYTEESLGEFQKEIAHAENEQNAVKEAEAGGTATSAQNKARIKAAADRLEEALAKFKAEETLALKSLADLNRSALAASYPLAVDAADAAGKAEAGEAAEKVTFSGKSYSGASFVGEESLKSVINLPTALFQKKDQLTVSFWAKDDGPNMDKGRDQAVFGIGADREKYVLVNTNREGRLRAVITTQSYRDEQGYVESNSAQAAFPKGTWAHLTLVFDGTQFSVYRNGELLGSRDTGIRISDLGDLTVACIGNSVWGNQDKDFIGSVKDFRIFNASLAEEQVKAVYSDRRQLEAEEAAAELVEAIGAKEEGDAFAWSLEQGAFTVPSTGNQGEEITWSSSDSNVVNIADKTAHAGKATVTASILLQGVTKKVVFNCTVFGKDAKEELNRLVDEIQKQAASGDYAKYGMDLVLKRAKELQAALSETAGEAEVKAAIAELDGLLEQHRVSIVSLKAAVQAAEAIVPNLSNYLEDGQEEFKSALKDAQADLAKAQNGEEVGKAEIAAVEARLKAAQDALLLKEDRGALDALVKQAKAESQNDYTAESWKFFQDILENAENVLKDPRSSKLALKAAEQALASAIDGLVPKANAQEIEDLNAAIASAAQLQAESANYTSGSWGAFEAALADARKAAQSDVKEEVLAAKASLQDARSRLVDISGLKAAIEEAGSLSQEAYTMATWTPFQEALVKANITIAEGHAAQKDVEDTAKALEDAKAALERKADTRELARKIEEAAALAQSDEYTYESRDALRKALAAAKEVISQERPQQEVNAAVKAIEDAKAKLARPVDKTDLNARIDEMSTFTGSGAGSQYIGNTWQALIKALEEAKKVAAGSSSSQEVTSALKGLDDAFAALVVRGDKTALNKQLEEIGALDSAIYVNWSALQAALEEAKKVQGNPDALQNDINAAVDALMEARGTLKVAEYKVTIDADNGTAAQTASIMVGRTLSEPPVPSKEGYHFAGWYVGDTAFDFGTPIMADTAITAKWEKIVLPSLSEATVQVAKAVYNGKARKPEVAVKLNGRTLVEGIDFTVKYSNNVKVGQGTATVEGIEGYTGSKSVKFSIVPAKVKNVKLSNKKGRKAAVKFSKAAGVKGYQVTYSTSSSFTSAKSKKVTKNSITLSGLKKNKTYYVKVRAYAKIGGRIVYGAYSTKVKVKIKK